MPPPVLAAVSDPLDENAKVARDHARWKALAAQGMRATFSTSSRGTEGLAGSGLGTPPGQEALGDLAKQPGDGINHALDRGGLGPSATNSWDGKGNKRPEDQEPIDLPPGMDPNSTAARTYAAQRRRESQKSGQYGLVNQGDSIIGVKGVL